MIYWLAIPISVLACLILAARFTERRTPERFALFAALIAVLGGLYLLGGAFELGSWMLKIAGIQVAILFGLLLARVTSARR